VRHAGERQPHFDSCECAHERQIVDPKSGSWTNGRPVI
jgi:hypothetical protein